MIYALIVKGTEADVREHLSAFAGIERSELTCDSYGRGGYATTCIVWAGHELARELGAWYTQEIGCRAPYAPGTLLHWRVAPELSLEAA